MHWWEKPNKAVFPASLGVYGSRDGRDLSRTETLRRLVGEGGGGLAVISNGPALVPDLVSVSYCSAWGLIDPEEHPAVITTDDRRLVEYAVSRGALLLLDSRNLTSGKPLLDWPAAMRELPLPEQGRLDESAPYLAAAALSSLPMPIPTATRPAYLSYRDRIQVAVSVLEASGMRLPITGKALSDDAGIERSVMFRICYRDELPGLPGNVAAEIDLAGQVLKLWTARLGQTGIVADADTGEKLIRFARETMPLIADGLGIASACEAISHGVPVEDVFV